VIRPTAAAAAVAAASSLAASVGFGEPADEPEIGSGSDAALAASFSNPLSFVDLDRFEVFA
jgi:hypothetical protein